MVFLESQKKPNPPGGGEGKPRDSRKRPGCLGKKAVRFFFDVSGF